LDRDSFPTRDYVSSGRNVPFLLSKSVESSASGCGVFFRQEDHSAIGKVGLWQVCRADHVVVSRRDQLIAGDPRICRERAGIAKRY
jgi:hypothetical protein